MRFSPLAAVALAAALTSLPGCRTGKPIVDVGPDIESARATVSGTVRGPDGTSPLAARTVEAVQVDGDGRVTARTNVTGSYTLQVPQGVWRIQLVRIDGEDIIEQPSEPLKLGNSEMETGIDFVVAQAGVADDDLDE